MVVRQQDESLGCKKITDITIWVQAFSIYAAILADSESSTSEQFKGLMSHIWGAICAKIEHYKIVNIFAYYDYFHAIYKSISVIYKSILLIY